MDNKYISKADKIYKENLEEILNNGTSTVGHAVRPKYADGNPSHTLLSPCKIL